MYMGGIKKKKQSEYEKIFFVSPFQFKQHSEIMFLVYFSNIVIILYSLNKTLKTQIVSQRVIIVFVMN